MMPFPDLADVFFRHWRTLARGAAVLAVPLLALGIGWLTTRSNPLLVLVPGAALLGLVVAAWVVPQRAWFPALVLVAAAFITEGLPTGTDSRIAISMVLVVAFLGVWVLRFMTVERRFNLVASPANKPVLLFMLIVLISLFWSNIFRDSIVVTSRNAFVVQAASGVVMAMLPAAVLLVMNGVTERKHWAVLVVVMLAAGVWLLPRQLGLIPGLPGNSNGQFTMWVVVLALGIVLFDKTAPLWVRGALAALSVGWLYWALGMAITWLSGWFTSVVALVILVWMRSKKLFAGLMLVFLLAIALNWSFVENQFLAEQDESGYTRLEAWYMNWTITRDHWLFGTGPAGYAAYYMFYFPTNAMATHNNYIDVVSQLGLTGFGVLMWMFGVFLWRGARLCQRLRGRGDLVEAVANATLAGTWGCLAAMMLGDWMFPFAYTQTIMGFNYAVYSWLFIGVMMTLDRLYPPEPQTN